MAENKNMESFTKTNTSSWNKTYDIIIIGDSYTSTLYGYTNGICRIGNYSAIIFNINGYPTVQGHLHLVENLISSGFIESVKPNYILLESAGRHNINKINKNSGAKNRIAYDPQSLRYWLSFGENIDAIVAGLRPDSILPLLQVSTEMERDQSIGLIDNPVLKLYNGESALFQQSQASKPSRSVFSHVVIPKNATLLSKIGLDPEIIKNSQTNGVIFTITITDESGGESFIFSQAIAPDTGFRLVTLPLDRYAEKAINITFITEPVIHDGQKNRYGAYWINPTIISNSTVSTPSDQKTQNIGIFDQILQIPDELVEVHEQSLLLYIWDSHQVEAVKKIKNTMLNLVKNQFDLPFITFRKARLTKNVHSSNVEYNTIYYQDSANWVRTDYGFDSLVAVNNDLNNLSDTLKAYNTTLLLLIPPDSSHIYEEYYLCPVEPKASQFYEDLKTIPKSYYYIDAYSILKKRIQAGERDLYPIFTTHWAPTAGSYVANEIVELMKNSSKGLTE